MLEILDIKCIDSSYNLLLYKSKKILIRCLYYIYIINLEKLVFVID